MNPPVRPREEAQIPRGLTWLVCLAIVVAALVPTLTVQEASAAVAIQRVVASNVTDTGFTISWVTSQPVGGYVKYGTLADQLSTRADDVRGSDYVGYTHFVNVGSLQAGITYYYSVNSSDSSTSTDPTPTATPTPRTIKTASNLAARANSTATYLTGTVFKADSITQAPGAIIQVFLQRNTTGSAVNSAVMSTYTDDNGYFKLDVMQARDTALAAWFTYTPGSVDKACYQYDAGGQNYLSTATCVNTSQLSTATDSQMDVVFQYADPPTATPTGAPTSAATATVPPTQGAATALPGRSPTRAASSPTPPPTQPPTATPPSAPAPLPPTATPLPPTPTPPPPPTPTVPPTATPQPTAPPPAPPTPTVYYRAPSLIGSPRPVGPPSAGFSQIPTVSPTAGTPVPTSTPLPDSVYAPDYAPESIVTLIVGAGLLLATGLGLVTAAVVSQARRRSV